MPARQVRVETVHPTTRIVGEDIVGTVRAKETVQIASTVMGKVVELQCALGAHVKAGDLVARLSVQELSARLDQARETVAQAELELARATKLRASGALPGAEFDVVASRARLARATLAEASAMAGYAAVRAPIAGVVIAKLASAGDMAMPGRPLCVIEDPSALRFEATVPERLARAFEHATNLEVRLDAIPEPLAAKVVEVSPNADATNRTVLVKLQLPVDPRIRAGTFGRAMVPESEVSSLTVPASALVRRGQLETVFVETAGIARMRLVRTGHVANGRIELRAGIREGDPVIVDAGELLVDGQPVAVTK